MTWQKHFDTPPAPGEIDPVRLLYWFQMAVDSLAVPEDVMQYICGFDAWDVQNLLVYGSNMMPIGWPHDSEIDAAPNNEEVCRVLDYAADIVCSQICHAPEWKEERPIEVSWNDRQYEALRKGYNPDMDFKFATFHRRGNFYVYRSGYILKKFRVKRGADGLWHITKVFTTAKEGTEFVMGEVINYGYWDVPLGNR